MTWFTSKQQHISVASNALHELILEERSDDVIMGSAVSKISFLSKQCVNFFLHLWRFYLQKLSEKILTVMEIELNFSEFDVAVMINFVHHAALQQYAHQSNFPKFNFKTKD